LGGATKGTMKVRREYIVPGIALLIVLAASGGVYQFYYKKQVEEFNKNILRLEQLQKALDVMEKKFQKFVPKDYIELMAAQVGPLATELGDRSTYFSMGDSMEIDPVPDDVMLKFYYEEQFNKMFAELRQKATTKGPYFSYPMDTAFGAIPPNEFSDKPLNAKQVAANLRKVKFGVSIIEMLMDADAASINEISVWPRYYDYGGQLEMHTVGLDFFMTMTRLVEFIDGLRLEDRYFNVNGISIQNPYLRYQWDPPLQVRMLLTQAEYVIDRSRTPEMVSSDDTASRVQRKMSRATSPSGVSTGEGQEYVPRQKTRWEKIRLWLRNHYLWPRY